jgi:hypothetical protein
MELPAELILAQSEPDVRVLSHGLSDVFDTASVYKCTECADVCVQMTRIFYAQPGVKDAPSPFAMHLLPIDVLILIFTLVARECRACSLPFVVNLMRCTRANVCIERAIEIIQSWQGGTLAYESLRLYPTGLTSMTYQNFPRSFILMYKAFPDFIDHFNDQGLMDARDLRVRIEAIVNMYHAILMDEEAASKNLHDLIMDDPVVGGEFFRQVSETLLNNSGFEAECFVLTCRRNLDLSCALMSHIARQDATIRGMAVTSSDSGVDGYRVLYDGYARRM